MQRLLATVLILAAAASCSETPPAQQAIREKPAEKSPAASTPGAETTRIAVGDTAPNFNLKDQTGSARSLDEMLADGNVALIFYRSADW